MTNEINGIDMTNEINGIDMTNEINGIDMTNEINGIDMTNEINGIDMTNEINGIAKQYMLGLGFKFPLAKEVSNFYASKDEEIYQARIPYLINTDDLLEELLRK